MARLILPRGLNIDLLHATEPSIMASIAERMEASPIVLSRAEFVDRLSEVVPEQAEPLSRVFVSLAMLRRTVGVGAFTQALRDSFGSKTSEWWSVWDALQDAVLAIVGSRAMSALVKSLSLRFDSPTTLRRARLITDIRPIFSEDASKIEAAIIAHVLRIEYQENAEAGSLALLLDEADIRELRDACERALMKGATAEAAVTSGLQVRVVPQDES